MNAKPERPVLARQSDVWHIVRNGRLIITITDKEATDKLWRLAEISSSSLEICDLALNTLAEHYLEAFIPDRVTPSAEALLITRYFASRLRDKSKDPPQILIGKIFDAIQNSPDLLWDRLGAWAEDFPDLVRQKTIMVPEKDKFKAIFVRHMPLLDNDGNVVLHVRIHEGGKKISFRADDDEAADYEDDDGRWKITARANTIGREHIGFNNVQFDNRLMAASAYRANFPTKDVFFMNTPRLGNYSVDIMSAALASHFFGVKGRERVKLGEVTNHEISKKRLSAKQDELMDRNIRMENPELGISEGVRVGDGTKHDRKKGHNSPKYDNSKTKGLYLYLRRHEMDLLRQLELCADPQYFRSYLTQDRNDTEFGEDALGVDENNKYPLAYPLRCIMISRDSQDGEIYEAVPVIVMDVDVRHGNFNRALCMRADVDYRSYRYKGKTLLEMSADDILAMMKEQNRKPGAIFHEQNLKKGHKVAFNIEIGLKAGLAPDMDADQLKAMRDYVVDHVDEQNRSFKDKVMKAYEGKHPFWYEADDLDMPYAEEEIYTPFLSNKYFEVELEDERVVRLPNFISSRISDLHGNRVKQLGDAIKLVLQPHRIEWDRSLSAANAYVEMRDKAKAALAKYQRGVPTGERLSLPEPFYNPKNVTVRDVMITLLNDRLKMMDKIPDPTKSVEVYQLLESDISGATWQRMPWDILATMQDHELNNLDDNGKLKIVLEQNPSNPTYRFALRGFEDRGQRNILNREQKESLRAETRFYTHGLPYEPDPERHRIPSAHKTLKKINEMRNNIRLGKKHLAAVRPEETGLYQIFAEDPQLADAILADLEQDCLRRIEAYPFDGKAKREAGFDPVTNEPILEVKYEIPRGDYVVVRVPDRLIEQPARDMRLGHTCVLVPDDERIRKAKHIVLQGAQTGRTFYAAERILHERPTGRSFDRLNDAINNGFVESGMQKPVGGLVLACAEIPPVALTNTSVMPDIKVPQQTITASVAPRLAFLGHDTPLRGVAMRKYDLNVKAGMAVRLRGTDNNGKLTGEEIPVQITKVTTLSLGKMIEKIRSKKLSDQDAIHYGFAHTEDMKDKLTRLFTKFDENVMDPDNTIVLLSYEPLHNHIDYRTEHGPRSCFNRFAKAEFVPAVIDFPDYTPPVPMLKLVMG